VSLQKMILFILLLSMVACGNESQIKSETSGITPSQPNDGSSQAPNSVVEESEMNEEQTTFQAIRKYYMVESN
jgi:hypothetical protein